MLLIINLAIIFTLLVIILFNIKNVKHQMIITLAIVSGLIIFKIVFDKMIKNNKKNDEVENKYSVNNDNAILNNLNTNIYCGCSCGCNCNTNKCNCDSNCNTNKCGCNNNHHQKVNQFDLKNLDYILNDMKNLSNSKKKKIDRVNVNKNEYIFSKHSGNKDYHFKDLHNGIFNERKNISEKGSLLLDNLDCSNDNSCIIKPTIYNFHKV